MGSVGCFSCFLKHKRNDSKDVPTKRLGDSSRRGKKPSISEDFWCSSLLDMDNSVAALSQENISSITASNHTVNSHSSDSRASEFVNHGLLLWNQTRQQWIGNKTTERRYLVEPQRRWDVSYERLLDSNKRFSRRIPLAEMVNFLANIWEHEVV